jgi:hypothetical protein
MICLSLYSTQASWEYLDNGRFAAYPDEINVIIENAFNSKSEAAEWQEESATYRVDFATMMELIVGDPQSPQVNVRRVTKGFFVGVFNKPTDCLTCAVSVSKQSCVSGNFAGLVSQSYYLISRIIVDVNDRLLFLEH